MKPIRMLIVVTAILCLCGEASAQFQRMLVRAGSYKLGPAAVKIPAQCLDGGAATPAIGDIFEAAADILVERSVAGRVEQANLSDAIAKKWIKVHGADAYDGVHFEQLAEGAFTVKVGAKGVVGATSDGVQEAHKLLQRESVDTAKSLSADVTRLLTDDSVPLRVRQFAKSLDQNVTWSYLNEDASSAIAQVRVGLESISGVDSQHRAFAHLLSLRTGKALGEEGESILKRAGVNVNKDAIDNPHGVVRLARVGEHLEITTVGSAKSIELRKVTKRALREGIGDRQTIVLEEGVELTPALARNLWRMGRPVVHTWDRYVQNLAAGPQRVRQVLIGAADPKTAAELFPDANIDDVLAASKAAREAGIEVVTSKAELDTVLASAKQGDRFVVFAHNDGGLIPMGEDGILLGELAGKANVDVLSCSTYRFHGVLGTTTTENLSLADVVAAAVSTRKSLEVPVNVQAYFDDLARSLVASCAAREAQDTMLFCVLGGAVAGGVGFAIVIGSSDSDDDSSSDVPAKPAEGK